MGRRLTAFSLLVFTEFMQLSGLFLKKKATFHPDAMSAREVKML
jgi:hypothetical protein